MSRYEMEQERLARQRQRQQNLKRQASISPPRVSRHGTSESSGKRPRYDIKTSSTSPHHATEADAASEAEVIDLDSPSMPQDSGEALPAVKKQQPPLQYPEGEVRKTWVLRHERQRDVKIEEVLQKTDLIKAVMSAFQWDVEWLLRKFNLQKTKLLFIMQAKDVATQDQYRRETKNMPFLSLCFPPMPGQVNCMHSKLMLLFHPKYLRIVVSSANLVPYDWGETGVMENSVFIIDLPRLDDGKATSEDDLTSFGKELIFFLTAMRLDETVRKELLNFDFTNTSRFAFVHTIGGSHIGQSLQRTGFPGLSKAVRGFSLDSPDVLELDYAASSIGSLTEDFLFRLFDAARGEPVSSSIPTKHKTNTFKTAQRESDEVVEPTADLASNFRIYFPTLETVKKSTGGTQNAGTICLNQKWYNAATFPRAVMRDYKSKRNGALSHNKLLFVRGQKASEAGDQPVNIAWAYVGSANISESAWGKLVADKATKSLKLNCRNWECGVLVALPASRVNNGDVAGGSGGVVSMDAFDGHVDVPFSFPAEKYGDRKPWFFMSG